MSRRLSLSEPGWVPFPGGESSADLRRAGQDVQDGKRTSLAYLGYSSSGAPGDRRKARHHIRPVVVSHVDLSEGIGRERDGNRPSRRWSR